MQRRGIKVVHIWLSCWLYVIVAIGAVLITLLICKWDEWNWSMKMTSLATTALICHVLEEWRFPGGFFYMLNSEQNKDYPNAMNCYPMNQLTDMMTNMIPICISFVIMLLDAPYSLSLMWFYLCFTDSMGHVLLGFKTKKQYATKGKKTIYNPGLFTSVFCFMPVFFGFVYGFIRYEMPIISDWIISIIGCAVLHVICLKVPEKLWGTPDSPYGFDWGLGYFEKFK